MNRFNALRYFCLAAETLHFKETANRLAVSPQVVSRMIAELEEELGETLFQRNTRNIKLTDFGQRFYEQAKQILSDTDQLFAQSKLSINEMAGLVRVALPTFPHKIKLIETLLKRTALYPKLVLDWRINEGRVNTVDEQIDVGVRVGVVQDNRFVIKRITKMGAKVVATPELITRFGTPKDVQDLQKNFPLAGHWNANTGRQWAWRFKNGVQFTPKSPRFIAETADGQLAATLSGEMFAHLPDHFALPYLKTGKLVAVLESEQAYPWELFVYRTNQSVTTARVKFVFEVLVEVLSEIYLNSGND
ncbi:LysR family transcriptional regulator [Pasteurellaceae bacterium LIM206]|nr:LysR family transcriptional regulator [Pasteurellaceae bacterium LIM206]